MKRTYTKDALHPKYLTVAMKVNENFGILDTCTRFKADIEYSNIFDGTRNKLLLF